MEKKEEKQESNWSWQKKSLLAGVVSLLVAIGSSYFNNILTEKRSLTNRLLETEKLAISTNAKVIEMEKYEADLIESMVTSDKVINDLKVRISFLERAIGLEEYVKFLKTHKSMVDGLARSESGDTLELEAPKPGPVVTAPIYEKPKDLSNMLNNQLQQTTQKPAPLLDKVKKEKFEKYMEGQRKQ